HQTIATSFINRDETQDARMLRWCLFPWHPAMTKEDRRRVSKTKQRTHCLDVVLSVNHVGRRGDRVEIVNDGHSRIPQILRCGAKLWAVNDGCMSAAKQARGQLADVKFRTSAPAQEVVGD